MVNRHDDLMALLDAGERLLMDGALGTELERRGLPIEGEGWSALAVRDHGEVIARIHRDYIDAGARLHIVNSFALARHVLEPIGLGDSFESLNRRAMALFDEAVAESGAERDSLWAAGSLSTFCANSDRRLLPSGDALVANCRDQAHLLADAGADLFALEMLFDCEVSRAMLDAVGEFGLPVIVGFTCGWNERGNGIRTLPGLGVASMPLEEVLAAAIEGADRERLIVSIMHSDFDVTDAALDVLQSMWSGPIAIYPNSGQFVDLKLQFDSVCDADDFAQAAQRWIRQGVQIVGGCCGIGPSHIRRLGGSMNL